MLAQIMIGPWTLVNLLIVVVVVAACIALVWVALRQFGIAIPQWV